MSARKRRLTPADRPEVLEEWKRLRDHYLRLGIRKTPAYKAIAVQYGCSADNVRSWLEPERRDYLAEKSSKYYHEVRKGSKVQKERDRPRDRKYFHLKNHIDDYLLDAMRGVRPPFTFEQASDRIEFFFGFRIRPTTLARYVDLYQSRKGVEVLVLDGGSPPAYRLAEGLRKHQRQDS